MKEEKEKTKKLLGIFYFQQIKQFKSQIMEVIKTIDKLIKGTLICIQDRYFQQTKDID